MDTILSAKTECGLIFTAILAGDPYCISLWLPGAKEQRDVSAEQAFELYIYACNSANTQLQDAACQATYDHGQLYQMLGFDQEELTSLNGKAVDRLVSLAPRFYCASHEPCRLMLFILQLLSGEIDTNTTMQDYSSSKVPWALSAKGRITDVTANQMLLTYLAAGESHVLDGRAWSRRLYSLRWRSGSSAGTKSYGSFAELSIMTEKYALDVRRMQSIV